MEVEEKNLDHKEILEELLEYKKLVAKLEKELFSKNDELSSLINNLKNLKQFYEKEIIDLKNEVNSLKQKNKELSDTNVKLENEKNDCISQFKHEIENLERLHNSTNSLVQNKNELNQKILEIEKIKNEEIAALRSKIVLLTNEKTNIEMEFREYKINKPNDIRMIKERDEHNINFKNNIENDKNEMKKSIELMKEQVRNNKNIDNINKILELKIRQYKDEKNNYLKDIRVIEEKYLNEIEVLKEKNASLNGRLDLLTNDLSYKDGLIYEMQKKFYLLINENKALENSKNNLLIENESLKDEVQNNLTELKELNNKREEEIDDQEDINKRDIKKLKKVIKEFKNKLLEKDKENFELKNKINKINEEKKGLIDKMMKIQNENNSAYFNANKKALKEYEKDNYIVEKEEEINSLNKYISKIKKEYYEAIDKKKYYKAQCKLFNNKIDIIKNNISKEQLQKIEKEIMEKGNNINDNNEDL